MTKTHEAKLNKPKTFVILLLLLVGAIGELLPFHMGIKEVEASPSQSGLIKVALTYNVAPRKDWSNGTLYHLNVTRRFIPIQVSLINDFSTLNNYQILFLNRLNISASDISTISTWTSNGGILVCIGQSGRYFENGTQRSTHPLATELGITFYNWERTVGANLGYFLMKTTWYWWSSSNAAFQMFINDGLSVPKANTVNATINGATQLTSVKDTSNAYETLAVSRNTYGSGQAYFLTADYFWHVAYYFGSTHNFANNQKVERPLELGSFTILWMMQIAILFDNFTPLLVIDTMPYANALHTAIGWRMHPEGRYPTYAKDVADEYLYANLTEKWKPQHFDSADPSGLLKGWFYQFHVITTVLDGTSNATNLKNFMEEYGEVHSHSHLHGSTYSTDILLSFNLLNGLNLGHLISLDMPAGSQGNLLLGEAYQLWSKNWTGLIGTYDLAKGLTNEPHFDIPFPIWNKTINQVQEYIIGWSASSGDGWSARITQNVNFDKNYGFGGYEIDFQHDFDSVATALNDTLKARLTDTEVWKTNDVLFMDWWKKRISVNMTAYSESTSQITVTLQTPDIYGLTLFLKGATNNIKNATVDGVYLGYYPSTNRLVIPHLSSGSHNVVINLASGVSPSNPYLQSGYSQGHIRNINNLTKAEWSVSTKKLTLEAYQSGTKTFNVNATNQGEPTSVKVNGTALTKNTDWWYFSGNKTVKINVAFGSSKELELAWGVNIWQMTFSHLDKDSNVIDSKITWQLYNASQLLTYTEGQYTLLDGTYTLKTYYHSRLLNQSSLPTATYGNSTINILMQMKAHTSVTDGYIAFNNTISSITINSQTNSNLTVTVTGSSPVWILADVPRNATYGYVQRNDANQTGWVYDESTTPDYIRINASTLSKWEFYFPTLTAIYNLNTKTVDWASTTLTQATVYYYNQTDMTLKGSGTVDANGWKNFTSVENGTYKIKVMWYGTVVNWTSNVVINGNNVTATLRSRVWNLQTNIRDNGGSTLVSNLYMTLANGTQLTPTSVSTVTYKVANGTFYYAVKWQNSWVYGNSSVSLDPATPTYNINTKVYTNFVISTKYNDGATTFTPTQITLTAPNATSKTLTSYTIQRVQNGTWTVTAINYWGVNVKPVTDPTFSPTGNSQITTITCRVYSINFASAFKDMGGVTLTVSVQSFKLTFPNATTSGSLTDGSYWITNGTTTWVEVLWQSMKVSPSGTFDATNGNPTINLFMKPHTSVSNGYIGLNKTATVTINSQTSTNLTFTASGTGAYKMIVTVPKNASYVQKDGVNQTGWIYDSSTSPPYIRINATTLSIWEFYFPEIDVLWYQQSVVVVLNVVLPLLFLIGVALLYVTDVKRKYTLEEIILVMVTFILAVVLIPMALNVLFGG